MLLPDGGHILEEVGERHVVLEHHVQRQVKQLTAGRLKAVPVDL